MKVYEDKLTDKEQQIYEAIAIDGLGFEGLMKKFGLARATICTHINSICLKKQVSGNCRLFALTHKYLREKMEKNRTEWNCTLCAWRGDKCNNVNSQFFGENLKSDKRAFNMSCSRFKSKEQK